MTEEEKFIYDNIVKASKRFKNEALARVITSIISENIDIKFKNT
jgi:hypothetical protein